MLVVSAKMVVRLESTLVGPLWARAVYSQKYPELLVDDQSVQLFQRVRARHANAQAEFVSMEEFIDEFYGLTLVIRARMFDEAIKAFLARHPNATVVNLGCGLDTTFSRVDNGQVHWYDLDLPAVIAYRRQLLPESGRNQYLARSVFDASWLKDVEHDAEDGVLCFAGGLLYYFPESAVAALVDMLARQFPQGELVFDMLSQFGARLVRRRFQTHGYEGINIHFGLGNVRKQITGWSPLLDVLEWFPMFSRITKNPKWKWKTRVMMRLSDWLNAASVVHVQFKP